MTAFVVTCAADIPHKRPSWDHCPHCPACHRRLVSADPAHTLAPFDGVTCPHCRANIHGDAP
jgi:hypothetical protein